MSIFSRIKEWIVEKTIVPILKVPVEINDQDWANENISSRTFDLKALAIRHELALYLKFDAPVKNMLNEENLKGIEPQNRDLPGQCYLDKPLSVEQLFQMCSMDVRVDPITFQPKFKFFDQDFTIDDNKDAYRQMHPKIMTYIKQIDEFEKASRNTRWMER